VQALHVPCRDMWKQPHVAVGWEVCVGTLYIDSHSLEAATGCRNHAAAGLVCTRLQELWWCGKRTL
jgi:hypothetical protein